VKIDEAFEGEREGERRREGDEYVYDYYWIDPDAQRGDPFSLSLSRARARSLSLSLN
jgi:hypothetical protein